MTKRSSDSPFNNQAFYQVGLLIGALFFSGLTLFKFISIFSGGALSEAFGALFVTVVMFLWMKMYSAGDVVFAD